MPILSFLDEFRKNAFATDAGRHTDKQKEKVACDIWSMTTQEFALQNCALRVRSRVLGEDVFFISNPKCLQLVDNKCVTYLPEELALLARMDVSPETLRRLHRAKKAFDAVIEGGVNIV